MGLVEVEPGQRTMPTAVFYQTEDLAAHEEPRRIYGRPALAAYVEGHEGRLMRSMKSILGSALAEQSTEVIRQPTEIWRVELTPQLVGTLITEPDALSISGLWQYARFLGGQGLDNGPYWLAFWGKVLQPLITASLVILAISFIFGPLRSVTLGQRIFTGVLVGFVFRIIQDLLGPASLPPAQAAKPVQADLRRREPAGNTGKGHPV